MDLEIARRNHHSRNKARRAHYSPCGQDKIKSGDHLRVFSATDKTDVITEFLKEIIRNSANEKETSTNNDTFSHYYFYLRQLSEGFALLMIFPLITALIAKQYNSALAFTICIVASSLFGFFQNSILTKISMILPE